VLLRAEGHDVLVDGGPEAGGVVRDLDEQDVGSLDAIFISHPHADHTDGVVDVLESLEVKTVIAPVTIGWGKGAEVVRAAQKARVPVKHASTGDVYRFGPDLEVEAISPEPGPAPEFAEELVHAFSLVLRARVSATTVLLPGDVGAEEEAKLLESDVRASVFVAPHHGSKDIDPRFVEAVEPRLTLVTVGADNRYGHPAPEAVKAYARHGRVYRTDRHGAVSLCVVESGLEVSTQR
jgi:competence protein ComEC